MAERRVQRVVEELRHLLQVLRLHLSQTEALVEHRVAQRHGDGERIRRQHGPQQAGTDRWQLGIDLHFLAALGEEGNALGQRAKEPFQLLAVLGQHEERGQHAGAGAWSDDTSLMLAQVRHPLLEVGADGGIGHLTDRIVAGGALRLAGGCGGSLGRHADQARSGGAQPAQHVAAAHGFGPVGGCQPGRTGHHGRSLVMGRDVAGGRFRLAMDAGRTAAQGGQTGWIELVLHGKPLLLGIRCLRGPRQGPRGASDGQQRDHSSPRAALTWPSVSASWLTGAATALRPASSRAPALKPFPSRYGSSALPNWA